MQDKPQSGSEAARALLKSAFVCDMTVPISMPARPERRDQLPRKLLDAGFTYASFTVVEDETDTLAALRALAKARRMFIDRADHCILVNTVDDIVRAKQEGKLAAGLHFQGTVAVGRDLNMVEAFYKLGIRHMLLAYNQRNFVADGCHELSDGGLSRFGRQLVDEMNRVGMMVDVAHTHYRSSMDAVERSAQPVICSHGNVHALHAHARCYRDDQIQAIAKSGGVFGLTGLNIFTGDDAATAEGLVRQVDYVAQLVGVQHVGLGLDYVCDLETLIRESANAQHRLPPEGGYTRSDVRQVELDQLPRVVELLLAKGYAADAVRLVLGGNWMRVMREVWKTPA